jgi:NitT/TauT family transport system substrate-binding protein
MRGRRAAAAPILLCAALVPALLLPCAIAPARGDEAVRIGIGYGLAFLPTYICDDLKLVEKYGREAKLDLTASYPRFPGAGPLQDAIASGAIDMGPYGLAPLLAQWEEAKNTPRQILVVSGLTTLPLSLLTNRANLRSLADLKPADRIALPAATAPQRYLLQMQSEKQFGEFDRLKKQMVVAAPSDAVAALMSGGGPAAYFASAPYTEIALEDGRVRKVLTSAEVIGGKASFLVMGATRGYILTHPKVPEAIGKAMQEAARIIRDDPHRAAQIYLAHEPSKALSGATIDAVITDIRDEFGSAVYGVQAFADFLGRHGELKSPPHSWKEIVAPALYESPST